MNESPKSEGPSWTGHLRRGVSPHFFRQHRLEKNGGLTPTPPLLAFTDTQTPRDCSFCFSAARRGAHSEWYVWSIFAPPKNKRKRLMKRSLAINRTPLRGLACGLPTG